MAKYTVISEIGMELVSRLQHRLTPEPVKNPDGIGLANPVKNPDFILSLFLYDIMPLDISLGTADMPGGGSRGYPFCLKYMLCTSSKGDQRMQAVEEQRILAKAIQVLNDNPVIRPGNEFLGENDLPLGIERDNLSWDDKSKIYGSMGGIWTAAFYQVLPVFIDGAADRRGSRVMEL